MNLRSACLPCVRPTLTALLACARPMRVVEVHSALSAMVAQDTQVVVDGEPRFFDALWASSLTCSAVHGLPDEELLPRAQRHCLIRQILSCSQKPLIVDGDTGGTPDELSLEVRILERLGAAGVIVEDKRFPKVNSLTVSGHHRLEAPDRFAAKLAAGIQARQSPDFQVIARIESFIAGAGLQDALGRAECYLEAGADGLMIHSKRETPIEILEFSRHYAQLCERLGRRAPLVAAPTTYNCIRDAELYAAGFSIVIHSNHLLLAAYEAMRKTARSILSHDRSLEASASIAPVYDLLSRLEPSPETYLPAGALGAGIGSLAEEEGR